MKRMQAASDARPARMSVLARALAAATLVAALSGCGALGLGGGSDDSDAQPAPRSTMGTFFHNFAQGGPDLPPSPATAPQTSFPSAVTQQDDNFECPVLDIAPNGAALRDPAGETEGGSQALRHQIAITRVARECKNAGANIAMKLAVEGSVLLGPSGSPGTFSIPLLFEAKLNDKVVASRRENLSVTIPANSERAFFDTVVTDFVIPKNDDLDLYVGLSPGGGPSLRPAPHRRRHAKR